jgi:accessory gene regulator protein AgrB
MSMNTLEKPRVSFESGTKRRKKAKRKKIIFNFLLLIIILVTAFSLDSVVKSKLLPSLLQIILSLIKLRSKISTQL